MYPCVPCHPCTGVPCIPMPPVYPSGCRHLSRVAAQISNKRKLLQQQSAEARARAGSASRQAHSEAASAAAGAAAEGGAVSEVEGDEGLGGATGGGAAAGGSEQQHRRQQQQQQQPRAKPEMPSAAEWAKAEEWRENKGRSKELYDCARRGEKHPEWEEVGGSPTPTRPHPHGS